MRIAFLGTPAFAVPSLDALAGAGHEVVAVVAQPDRPAGRGQELREPATKAWGRARGVPVLQPLKIRDGSLAAALGALAPDLLVVVAYGRILGDDLLGLAPHGAAERPRLSPPALPGRRAIQWAVAEGERETGVTVMQMDAGLDTGDILLQRALLVGDDDAEALSVRLASLGGEALVLRLRLLESGQIIPVRQDHARATLAPVLTKEDGRLDFRLPASRLAARVLGFRPWPGAFTTISAGAHSRFIRRWQRPAPGSARPGTCATRATAEGLLVGCGDGTTLLLREVQVEGKRRVPASEFLKGHPLPGGAVLGA